MTKVVGIDFKSAVLNLYYQKISLIQLTLRKITIESSVKNVPKGEQRETKPDTVRTGSLPREQNNNISQNNKKLL